MKAKNQNIAEMKDGGIGAGLMLLALATPPGHTRTAEEIAEVCGCSRSLIWNIENRALKKLQTRLPGRIKTKLKDFL